jgi:hypothetical protein
VNTGIRNCVFAFRCEKQWNGLAPTTHPDVKFCGMCQREVFLCQDDESLVESIRLNRCVAIDMENHVQQPQKLVLMGSMRAR